MSQRRSPDNELPEDPFRQRESQRYDNPIASRELILSLLREERAPLSLEAIAERLDIDDEQRLEALRRRLGAMQRDGQLIRNRRGGLVPVDDHDLVAGRIIAHPDGFGFLVTDDDEPDVYLGGKEMRQVLHGDRVVVNVTGTDYRDRRQGRIVEVLERANHSIVGRLQIEQGVALILPDNKRIHQDINVAPTALGGARHGDVVVAEIVEQPTRRHPPVARIVEVLGEHLEPGMEIDIALRSHEIPHTWPEAVDSEAAGFSTEVRAPDMQGRKDVRSLPLITIDGADARDFDDAVYCERTPGGWRLLVAIADVAHYVRPGSALDEEAITRGTSVYFPGRVVPMLPEVLSNGLCSLNPEVNRLCMLAEMTLDDAGRIKRTRFYNGLMRSHARLTYTEVYDMLMHPDGDLAKRYASLLPHLQDLHALYKVLLASRQQRGAIEFESVETRIIFDENKKIREIVPVERNDAHRLIEECMILANIAAARLLEQVQLPALYRVHHGPKADRLEDLRSFLKLRGLGLGGGLQPTALDYAHLAEQIANRSDRSVIQTVMLRSMQQAVYQPKNDGHFGLALTQYAHFTSPIRRYPDLLVHRAIKHALARQPAEDYHYSTARMQQLGEQCSMTERRADDATREVVSWLKCEYMQDQIGEVFAGVISAVVPFGLFVELTGVHVEGLVHVTNLDRDYYRYEQAAQALVGERSGQQFRLGDSLRVRVTAVNLEDRKIDFALEEGGVMPFRDEKRDDKRAAPAHDRGDRRDRKRKRRDRQRREAEVRRGQEQGQREAESARIAAIAATLTTDDDAPAGEISSAGKKTAGKKTAGKKTASKKTASKKTASKKTASKKTASKKTASKKTASKKTASKKTASKKTASKKTASKKTASKKSASKKSASKKSASKKSASKKIAGKKAARRDRRGTGKP